MQIKFELGIRKEIKKKKGKMDKLDSGLNSLPLSPFLSSRGPRRSRCRHVGHCHQSLPRACVFPLADVAGPTGWPPRLRARHTPSAWPFCIRDPLFLSYQPAVHHKRALSLSFFMQLPLNFSLSLGTVQWTKNQGKINISNFGIKINLESCIIHRKIMQTPF